MDDDEDMQGDNVKGAILGGSAYANHASLLGFQQSAQGQYLKQQALTIALQAGGSKPIDQLLADADRVVAWLKAAA